MRLKIEYLPTESLVPYANNAKKHPDAQIKQIQASIERYEFSDVIGIWHNEEGQPEIVYGHGSVLAAKRMGMAKAPYGAGNTVFGNRPDRRWHVQRPANYEIRKARGQLC